MARISAYPSGSPATINDYVVIARGAANYKIPILASIPGYIQENACQLLYVGAAAYSVLPGTAYVNGELLSWSSNIARAGLALAANTLYYTYLYNNAGTPAMEESTTVPVWSNTNNYYQKTGDASRRCIGWIETNAAAAIRRFVNVVQGRVSEIIYVDGDTTGRVPVNAGTATAAWTSFSLTPLVPTHATHVSLLLKMIGTTLGDDGVVGVSPIDLGAAPAANMSPHYIRGRASAANANVFAGATWMAISTAQTYYYRLLIVTGTPAATIEIHGAKIIR